MTKKHLLPLRTSGFLCFVLKASFFFLFFCLNETYRPLLQNRRLVPFSKYSARNYDANHDKTRMSFGSSMSQSRQLRQTSLFSLHDVPNSLFGPSFLVPASVGESVSVRHPTLGAFLFFSNKRRINQNKNKDLQQNFYYCLFTFVLAFYIDNLPFSNFFRWFFQTTKKKKKKTGNLVPILFIVIFSIDLTLKL